MTNKTKKQRNFDSGIIALLYNMSMGQNNNENLTDGQILYYRGILLAVAQMAMKFYNIDFYQTLKYICEFAPLDSYYIISQSIHESWRDDWKKITLT